MKKYVAILFILIYQQTSSQSLIGGNNILKTNLSGDAIHNYNITFERSISRFMSISLSYRTMPKSSLPLQAIVKQFINNPAIDFDNIQVGNNALTAEARFYLGFSKMAGFYVAPYTRSATIDLTIPVHYTYQPTSPLPGIVLPPIPMQAQLDGTIRSTSYGAYVGMQFQLLTKLVLDVWMIGGHYGQSNGKLQFTPPTPLPALAVAALQKTLDETKATPFTLKSTVTANSAVIDTEGPWAGIRGLGITVGLRF